MPLAQPISSKKTEDDSSQFQRRWEPSYHWRSMCSMLLGMPGLRAAWPMSVVGLVQPECTDISGHGYHLSTPAAIGTVVFGYGPTGVTPMAYMWGLANCYLFRADAGALDWADIGTVAGEFQIRATQRGLSLGGWFWWQALPGAFQFLMGKDDGGANRQYSLRINAGNTVTFEVWPGPVNVTSAATINTDWNHVLGIYDRTTQDLYVVLNGVVATNAGGAPAALNDTGASFTIGADGAGANRFVGYTSDCFLSACSLNLGFAKAAYHYTKAAYGVK